MSRFPYIGRRLRYKIFLMSLGIFCLFAFMQYELASSSNYIEQNGKFHLLSFHEHMKKYRSANPVKRFHSRKEYFDHLLRQNLTQDGLQGSQVQAHLDQPGLEHLKQPVLEHLQVQKHLQPPVLEHLTLEPQQIPQQHESWLQVENQSQKVHRGPLLQISNEQQLENESQSERQDDYEQRSDEQLRTFPHHSITGPRNLWFISETSLMKLTIQMGDFVRLGNLMFCYASMLGIARKNGLTPIIVAPNLALIQEAFQITTPVLELSISQWELVEERFAGTFDPKMDNIARDILTNSRKSGSSLPEGVTLKGYYQSWKYFDFIRDDIIKEFKFQKKYARLADKFIMAARKLLKNPSSGQLVGIHIRRGDLITHTSKERGYTMATPAYLARAIKYMETHLKNTDIVYIVCSEDTKWFRENVETDRLTEHHIVYSPNGHLDGAIDLAILARCDHMIESVGTYSWWAGYLVDGMVIYYSNFPAKNSELYREYKPEDHFPPYWIPLR